MNDDWRVALELESEEHGRRLTQAVQSLDLEQQARAKVGDHVVVSHEGPHVFLYTDSEEHAGALEQMVRPLLTEHGLDGDVSISRWHPVEERWEDASSPLPSTPEEIAAERERLDAAEREESREQGYPEWELRLVLPSRHEAHEFARRLEAEGIPAARRWKCLIVAAETEEDARSLAARLRDEAPPGTEFNLGMNEDEVYRRTHPFGFLGGLGQ